MSRYASAIPLHEWRTRRLAPAAPKRRRRRQAGRDLPPPAPDFVYDVVPEDDDPEPAGELGAAARRGPSGLLRRAAGRVQDALTPGWGPDIEAGTNLRVRARKGFRAAVVEVKPGLYVVAEVPERAVEFGFGPLLLAPALARTLTRAMRKRQDGAAPRRAPLQLPGPTEDEAGAELPRWLDDEDAAELGCARCRREEP